MHVGHTGRRVAVVLPSWKPYRARRANGRTATRGVEHMLRRFLVTAVIALALGLLAMQPSQAVLTNLVANGGFETPVVASGAFSVMSGSSLTGWTISGSADLVNKDFQGSYPVHGG